MKVTNRKRDVSDEILGLMLKPDQRERGQALRELDMKSFREGLANERHLDSRIRALSHKLSEIIESDGIWGKTWGDPDKEDEALEYILDALLEIIRANDVVPSFNYSVVKLGFLIDRMEDPDEQLRYLTQLRVQLSEEERAPEGVGTWIKNKITSIKADMRYRERTSGERPRSQKSEQARSPSVPKIRWTTGKVILPFMMRLLWKAGMIDAEIYEKRHEYIVAHFCDRNGKNFNIDSLRVLDKQYQKNKISKSADGEAIPRGGEKIQAMIQALHTLTNVTDEDESS